MDKNTDKDTDKREYLYVSTNADLKSEKGRLRLQRNCLVFLVFTLVASNLVLTVTLNSKDTIVRLIPTIDRELVIGSNFVSDEYLLLRANQILSLVFSMNRENIQETKVKLLSQVDNSVYSIIKEQIDKLSEDINLRGYRYSWHDQTSAKVLRDGMTVQVSGYASTYVANREIETIRKTYEIKFINNNGIVVLSAFSEVREVLTSEVESNDKIDNNSELSESQDDQ